MKPKRLCAVDMCHVPVPHKHEPPSEAMVLESRETITLEHPPVCEWRNDVYGSCSCGVTGLVTQLYSLHAVVTDDPLALSDNVPWQRTGDAEYDGRSTIVSALLDAIKEHIGEGKRYDAAHWALREAYNAVLAEANR